MGSAAQDVEAFRPDTVVQSPGGARIVVLGSRTGGVAALRLSVPLVEHAAEAGAGAVLGALALERMSGPARQIGAQARVERTPWGLSYLVEGAEADIEYLTYLLRLAVQEPAPAAQVLSGIRDRLAADLRGEAEASLERLLGTLQEAAVPGAFSVHGTPGTIAEVSEARLREVWSRSHRASHMSVVAVTAFDPAVLLANLHRLGAQGDSAPPLGAAPAPIREEIIAPPALRSWHALAWSDHSVSDPHAAVLARLITSRIESGPSEMEMTAQLRQLSDRSLLVVAGAAQSRRAPAVRARVAALLGELRDSLDVETVAAARSDVTLAYRRAASNPAGLAEHFGRAWDATGDLSGASAYLVAASTITRESLAAYIDGLEGPFEARVSR
jgi:predicted Zn-dependent peptidase